MAAKMKRMLFSMQHDRNEPLGVMHLQGLARQHGVDARTILHKDFDFEPLMGEIRSFKPDLVGFSIWTGAHVQCFAAADRIQEMGIPVVFGGPHVTYYTDECLAHCNWAVKGKGYRPLRRILYGEIPPAPNDQPGVLIFDQNAMAEGWPAPYRDQVYRDYPELRDDPQGNVFSTEGCVYLCTYCNSPENNLMYGGFKKVYAEQELDQVIRDAQDLRDRWGKKKIYFQDDIFGFKIDEVLKPFRERWRREVGLPFHCQMRPEMMKVTPNGDRLQLIREAGCTGMSVAIESAIPFIREHVLLRKMDDELIESGFRRAKALGLNMRSEQISMKPFDSEETDLQLLLLNNRMRLDGVDMMWLTLFTAYGETPIGKIVHKMGFSVNNKDMFKPTSYYDRSWIRHSLDGPIHIEPVVRPLPNPRGKDDSPLFHMHARPKQPGGDIYTDETVDLYMDSNTNPDVVGELRFRTPESNADYVANGAMFQRVINFLHRIPNVENLARRWREANRNGGWTWENLGRLTEQHLREQGYAADIPGWRQKLADGLGCEAEGMPEPIAQNPFYFCVFPDGPRLAEEFQKKGVFEKEPAQMFSRTESITRGWAFHHRVSPTEPAEPPIINV